MGEEERKDEEKPVSSKDDERKEYNMVCFLLPEKIIISHIKTTS
jgi:hypothetical protein